MGCSRFDFGLQDAGVALVFGSFDDDVDQLASIMKEFTAVVACLPSGTASQGDLKLIGYTRYTCLFFFLLWKPRRI